MELNIAYLIHVYASSSYVVQGLSLIAVNICHDFPRSYNLAAVHSVGSRSGISVLVRYREEENWDKTKHTWLPIKQGRKTAVVVYLFYPLVYDKYFSSSSEKEVKVGRKGKCNKRKKEQKKDHKVDKQWKKKTKLVIV